MTYREFIAQNARFLGFGFALAALSSVGQTFFISLFGAEIRNAFTLTHGEFGGIYSIATLASATCLAWVGQRTDNADLRRWSCFVLGGLGGACLLMAWAPVSLLLGIALFGLRFFGQGLASHTSVVSMARYFDVTRGRAVSIAALGHPIGEGLLPVSVVAIAAIIGWRETWLACGILLLAAGIPTVLWLLRGHAERHQAWLNNLRASTSAGRQVSSRSRAEMLRDPVFFMLLPAAVTSSYVVTGLFFHQAHVAATKGWPLTLLAASFAGYATASVITSLIAGYLIDRRGASRILPFAMGPLTVGLLALALSDDPLIATLYLTMAGASQGITATVQGVLWAEIYGSRHIGAIRALIAALSVFSSALGPASMGWLIDAGVDITTLALASIVMIGAAVALALVGLSMHHKRR
ncbi:MAG: MFS family permease [Gammaproteobacteria bacterium]|jgi:MFS family permease